MKWKHTEFKVRPISYEITPYSLVEVRALLAACFSLVFLLGLLSSPEDWWQYVPPKSRLAFTGLHSTISQKRNS
jgi:hypothetical protein